MKRVQARDYYTRVPAKRMRKLGDALLACTQGVGGGLTLSELIGNQAPDKAVLWFSFTITVVGVIGKFLSNFYSED